MTQHQPVNGVKNATASRNRLIFVGGLLLLGIALALLIFSGSLFGGSSTAVQSLTLPQVPAQARNIDPLTGLVDPVTVGNKAYNFALADLDGQPVTLSDFAGQPVLVNFWATWCPPCRMEMPGFESAIEAHRKDGLVILAVNQYEDADTVRSFFTDEMGFTFTPLLDLDGEVGKAYGASNLPASIFVAPTGEVTAVHRGMLTEAQLNSYLAEILP